MNLVDGPILPNDCALHATGYQYFLTLKWDIGCDPCIIEDFSANLKRVMACFELNDVECWPEGQVDECENVTTVTNQAYSFVYPDNNLPAECRTIIGPDNGDAEERSYITTPQTIIESCPA